MEETEWRLMILVGEVKVEKSGSVKGEVSLNSLAVYSWHCAIMT